MIKEIKSKTDFHFKMLPIFSFSVPAIDCIALFQDNTEKKLPIISKAVPDPIHLITIFDEQISQLFFSKMKRLQTLDKNLQQYSHFLTWLLPKKV